MKYNRINPPWILLECNICIKTEHVKYNRMSPARALLEEIISLKKILIIRKMQRNEPSQESSGRHKVHQKYDKHAVQDGL